MSSLSSFNPFRISSASCLTFSATSGIHHPMACSSRQLSLTPELERLNAHFVPGITLYPARQTGYVYSGFSSTIWGPGVGSPLAEMIQDDKSSLLLLEGHNRNSDFVIAPEHASVALTADEASRAPAPSLFRGGYPRRL
jgi:hypothetical protein